MLDDEAATIAAAVQHGDLDAARRRLPALVGRDPSQLDEAGIARAVIESLAENGVDAVVASGGGSVAGAGRADPPGGQHLDAMVGHRNDRYRNFGWPAPASTTCPTTRRRLAQPPWRQCGHAGRGDLAGCSHGCASASVAERGWIEAAYAAALGVRLGGANRYGDVVEPAARSATALRRQPPMSGVPCSFAATRCWRSPSAVCWCVRNDADCIGGGELVG